MSASDRQQLPVTAARGALFIAIATALSAPVGAWPAQGQSVMLATNEIMATCALAFCAAALLIWLAPRTARVVDMRKVGH
jgi:hypothetical protein